MTADGRPVWTDPEWIAVFTAWIDAHLALLDRRVIGSPEQPHVRPWSTVFRVATDRGPVWAKAAAPATAHEARLLPAMARWGIRSIVPPLATDGDRGWLLLEDGGTTLRETHPDGEGDRDLTAWERILGGYAELQRALEGHADRLIRLGVPDGRPATLPGTLEALLETDAWWELVGSDERAASDAARRRLRDLGEWVAARSRDLASSGIPSTIQHGDLHGGNIFVGPAGDCFFDWGDAVVAHPFASLVTVLESIAFRLGTVGDDPLLDRLRDAYLEAWTDVQPRAALREVLATAIDMARIGKAAAWARSLGGLEPAAMDGHGDAPALWLGDLVERLDARAATT